MLKATGIGVGTLWLHYFRLGGDVGVVEIDAYLHHAVRMPRLERDLWACAATELIDHGVGGRAPYSWEPLEGDRKETADGEGGADGDGGPDSTA